MTLAMTWQEWVQHDAVGLAECVRRGDVSPTELAQQAATGVALINPAVQAVVEVFDDVVADPLKDGLKPEGPFAGVPFFMKDLGPTLKGRLQEMGAQMMRGNRATADTFLTGQMRRAGLNIIGRTTTPEFGVCSSAENPAVYVTRNPWNPEHTSYGSSAGTAVALAAGVLPLSHATDGGGSIRIPAGANGNIGLKPSRGVFSIAPAASDLTGLVSTQGCQSRTVRDTAAFVDHCRGGAPGEFMPYWMPPEPYSQLIGRDPPRLRIALSHEWGDFRAVPHFVDELERVGRFLEGLGHQVDWALPEVDFRAAFDAQTTCYISNFAQTISNLLTPRGLTRPPADLVEPINIKIWEMGLNTSFTERARMQAVFNTTSRAFGQFFEDWDIILTPITALPTPKMGTLEYLTTSDNPSVLDWFNHLWCNFAYTPLTNLCGMPGISMPMAWQENGLPLGIHAQAKQANDGLLLQLASQIERALGGQWHAGRFNTSWDTVCRSVKWVVDFGLKHRDLDGITAIGVDEVSYSLGHQYMTLVYQINNGSKRLLGVIKDRKTESLAGFFEEFGTQRCARIKVVCSDMWKPYLNVIARMLPAALNVLDRFHIAKKLGEAVDEVRRTETKELKLGGYDPVLSNSRYCFLKRPANLTASQDTKLKELLRYDLKSVSAYLLKESFDAFWQYESSDWARWFLRRWCQRTMRSRLEPMKKFVKTLRAHEELLMNYFKAGKAFSSGIVEGLNLRVNLCMRKAYGYRSFDLLQISLFHTLGDLPEPKFTHRFF